MRDIKAYADFDVPGGYKTGDKVKVHDLEVEIEGIYKYAGEIFITTKYGDFNIDVIHPTGEKVAK